MRVEVGKDGVEGVVGRRQQDPVPAESAHTNIVGTVGQLVHVIQSLIQSLEWRTRNSNGVAAMEIQQWKYSNGDTAMEIQQWR